MIWKLENVSVFKCFTKQNYTSIKIDNMKLHFFLSSYIATLMYNVVTDKFKSVVFEKHHSSWTTNTSTTHCTSLRNNYCLAILFSPLTVSFRMRKPQTFTLFGYHFKFKLQKYIIFYKRSCGNKRSKLNAFTTE